MSNSNLQQWWEHTYRQHQTNQQASAYDSNILQQQQQQQYTTYQSIMQHLYVAQELKNISVASTTAATTAFIETSSIEDLSGNNDYDTSAFDNYYFINSNIFSNSTSSMSTDSEYAIPSMTLLFMAIAYGLVVFGGVLGNATLVLTLCSASSVRLRNPLLLAVCIADLLVTGVSAPVTLLNLAMIRTHKTLPLMFCKLLHYIQVMPVAASTISFFLLSLDRYATVKHPRMAQLRQRRYLHATLAVLSWLTSAAISVPFLFAYKIIIKSVPKNINTNISTNTSSAGVLMPKIRISCSSILGENTLFVLFVFFHTFSVYVLPGVGVLLNHYGVRQKLCALSLTARAAHGELPLPMPILRRQTHMVIVTGIAKVQKAATICTTNTEDTSNEAGGIQLHNLNPTAANGIAEEEDSHEQKPVDDEQVKAVADIEAQPAIIQLQRGQVIKSTNPISPRAMREIRAHSQRQRIQNNNGSQRQMPGSRVPATPGIPLPQTSTLQSRRLLANMLIASALIFILCWAPHVFCIFYTNFGYKQYCNTTATYFNLLLGYMYSAISPVIYWILNHNTLRQSPCAPIIRLRSMQNFLRTHFRSNTVPPPAPSSTNEAALGAFNPKFIKLTPKQYRAHASSHYLY